MREKHHAYSLRLHLASSIALNRFGTATKLNRISMTFMNHVNLAVHPRCVFGELSAFVCDSNATVRIR